MSLILDLKDSRSLLANLTLREIRGKYKRTVLGQAWSLLNPIASLITYSLVFSFVLRVQVPVGEPSGLHNFMLFLACGLIPWNFFVSALNAGMSSLVGNANLLQKVYFYRPALVISAVLACGFTFLIELSVLLAFLLAFGGAPLVWIPMLLVMVVLLSCFALGLGLLLSVANVYFRDTQHFLGIVLQIWFYLTSIVYPFSLIESKAAEMRANGNDFPIETLYRLNPMERFVEFSRSILYDNTWPDLTTLMYCFCVSVACLVVGAIVFERVQGRIVEEL